MKKCTAVISDLETDNVNKDVKHFNLKYAFIYFKLVVLALLFLFKISLSRIFLLLQEDIIKKIFFIELINRNKHTDINPITF